MLASLLISCLPAPVLTRDAYGVPHISAPTAREAYVLAGYSCAQDRLWQMENSRRLALGQLAEAFGPDFAASDREQLRNAYDADEYQAQIDGLNPELREAYEGYAEGVNRWISEASASGQLPPEYAKYDLKPRPWTEVDSAAIAVRLYQQFGRGGAGEIRNMALLGYLSGQKLVKNKAYEVLSDLAWFNDKRAVTTIAAEDDPLAKQPPLFSTPTRAQTEAHLALLPKMNLLELLPGVRLAERAETTRVAENLSAPFKMGSYCIVVGKSRSATGYATLLNGPQMGFRQPSIVHEMSIRTPSYAVVGMDVPGVPGVLIGHSETLAWGFTSGVADTDDVVFSHSDDDASYTRAGKTIPLETKEFTLNIKGRPSETVVRKRTQYGPVVLTSKTSKVVFSRHATAWKQELRSMRALWGLYNARTVFDADKAAQDATVNFNVFCADRNGNIAYRYGGLTPIRADGVDPRFPTPGEPQYDWKGMVPVTSMPHVVNPKSGLIVNWNNKPVAWWPNGDTPVWGRMFRNTVLLDQLKKPKLSPQDMEFTIWNAARSDYNYSWFKPYLSGLDPLLDGFDGHLLDGSISAGAYLAFFDALREELFLPAIGNLISPDNFKLAIQPSLILDALEGKTHFNYLGRRSRAEVLKAAWAKAQDRLKVKGTPDTWRYVANGIAVEGQPPIPYSDRGTYIQVVELLEKISGRNVLPMGVAERGAHQQDQVPLSRAWIFKKMGFE